MIHFQTLFLQGQPGGSNIMTLVFFGAMILVFWLFMIRPQAKKQKEQRKFMESLEKGDEVVTASGILGRINKIEDNIITLEVGTKAFIRVLRSAISKEMTDSAYGDQKSDKK